MPHLTSFEAKQVAAYLKASSALITDASTHLKLGQWLEVISRSCGFRDWNAMSAVVPKQPDNDDFDTFFGVARVFVHGRSEADHFIWFRDQQSSPIEVANKLADLVSIKLGHSARGSHFSYSQPDVNYLTDYTSALRAWPATSKDRAAPIVAVSSNQQIKILLWWLCDNAWARQYTTSEGYSVIRSFFFSHDGAPFTSKSEFVNDVESLTNRFLATLTGIHPHARTCLYIPEFPNGVNDSFIPVIVREGHPLGTTSELNYGTNRLEACRRAIVQNLENGISEADMWAISSRYRESGDDPVSDYSGIYE
ncbi:hypothetical protein KSF73_01330 [Burkholderiaceae bacterium DAT-1]|nr:hypothetical protein [Burkholderiaceae bacterium DAT-1]